MPINIQIIYQDDALLVINKPSGILSLPDGYNHDAPHISRSWRLSMEGFLSFIVWIKKQAA